MKKYIQVVTTTDQKESAEKLANYVVEKQLAACVQISTCLSVYRWQGKIENAEEYHCTMKSRADLYPELEKAIRKIHNYEVPEIIATEISNGGSDYFEWLETELRTANIKGN